MDESAKRNLVIFVGAGFSSVFGIPVMSAFSDKLRDLQLLNPTEQREFDNIQQACDTMGALIGSSSRNVEQLSSFLAIQQINSPEFTYPGNSLYRDPSQALALVKKSIYKLVNPDLTTDDVKSKTQFFDDRLFAEFHVSFVTTNYDLVLETMGHCKNRTVRPTKLVLDKGSKADPYSIYACGAEAPSLYKLHGSANWFYTNNSSDDLWVADKWGEHRVTRARKVRSDHTQKVDDCVIVPPSVIKPKIDALLCEQWRGATEALREADAVWFVGYSFPESDSFMRFFLASAFGSNMRIRQLVVIDPDVAVKARSLKIFRAERLKEVFAFIPLEWERVTYAELQAGNVWNAVRGLHPDSLDDKERLRSALFPEGE